VTDYTVQFLPHELRDKVGLEQLEYGIAVTDDGTVIGFYAVDLRLQYQSCSTCVGRCCVFKYLWVEMGYRGDGLFNTIRAFIDTELEIEKLYTLGGGAADSDVFVYRYGVEKAKGYSDERVSYEQAETKAKEVLALIQEAVNS